MNSVSDIVTFEAVKEYYEKLRSEITTKEDAIVLVVMSSILFSVSAVKSMDDPEDKRRFIIAEIYDKIGNFLNTLDYDEIEVHKKVMKMIEMVFMDYRVIQKKVEEKELN